MGPEFPTVVAAWRRAWTHVIPFFAFPPEVRRVIYTTNTVENLNREFRRRTKTQASFGTEDAALTVLYGLVALGHIQLRKIDGHQQPSFLAKESERRVRAVE